MTAFIDRMKSFRDDESGSMVLFAIYVFCAILLLGGLSLTVITHEATRLRLQNTIDMAVLAAADLNQQLEPEDVVRDYFNKAGLIENLKRVKVTETLNSREVLAEAEMSVDTMLLSGLTSDSWNVKSAGAAREDISNIEVSMVLDSSGSMGNYGRMTSLKAAAKDFVDDILLTGEASTGATPVEGEGAAAGTGTSTASADSGEVSISLIPYSTQVSMPQIVLDELTLGHRHAYSGCIDFEVADFLTTALPTALRAQTAHFDPSSTGSTPSRWVCSPSSSMEATLFSQDANALKNAIDGMDPYQYTSIDVGVKWGAAMLDPSAQDIVDALADADIVDEDFRGRPYSFASRNKMKVLVVMTDGENTTQYQLDDAVASGMSDVWEHNGNYSVFAPEGNQGASLLLDSVTDVMPTWSWGHGGGITGPQFGGGNGNNGCGIGSGWNNGNYNGGGWNNGGNGNNNCGSDDGDDPAAEEGDLNPGGSGTGPGAVNNVPEDWFIVADNAWATEPEGGDLAQNLGWQDVWAEFTLHKHADEFRYDQYHNQADFDEWYDDIFTTVGATEKDARMQDICTAAKDAGILIFAIGFEISDSNADKMRACASSSNHYFDVDSNTIDLAFAAIANSINQLRLIQ